MGAGGWRQSWKGAAMTIVTHIVNTPNENAQNAYRASWRRIDERGLHHPRGRQSHTAFMVGNVLHVVDVWDSEEAMNAFMMELGPILDEFGMHLAAPPEIGDLLQIVRPES
jgi:hypothetical protein